MVKEKKEKFQINKLYYYANLYRQQLTEEEEIEKIDMTQEFYEELNNMIKNHELINLNINGRVRLGKSTEAMALGMEIFAMLQKHKFRKKTDKFNIKNIARDDQEFSKMMRDPKLEFTIIVTDESNELEKGGENSSVESALAKVFSEVQAGRYVHRICCSPNNVVDSNADIMLEVISTDRKRKISHNRLYYRIFYGGVEYRQLLGYVNIEVGDLIKTWDEKVKKLFFKPNKTKKELEEIDKLAKKDWYTEYMIKKYEKMELITKEGIFRPRILDYAKVILTIIKKLKPLCKFSSVINQNIVRNYVKIEMRKEKIPMSIIGEELASREVMGILELHKSFNKVTNSINALKTKAESRKISPEQYTIQLDGLENIRDEIRNAITLQEQELEKYNTINEKYNKYLIEDKSEDNSK